jgi:hypothetical protein
MALEKWLCKLRFFFQVGEKWFSKIEFFFLVGDPEKKWVYTINPPFFRLEKSGFRLKG